MQYSYFGPGSGLILIDDLDCTGTETSLFNCSHLGIGTSNCFHSEDISVLCQGTVIIISYKMNLRKTCLLYYCLCYLRPIMRNTLIDIKLMTTSAHFSACSLYMPLGIPFF